MKEFQNTFSPKQISEKGFTLVEVLVGVAVFLIVSMAIYSTYSKMIQQIADVRAKSAAATLANEQFEIIRNLPYAKVGVSGGIPNGVLVHVSTTTRSGKNFIITTTVRNYDDPFDGILGGSPNDLSPADGKIAEIEIACTNCTSTSSIVYSGRISPKNLETASTNGALFIKVFDANGQDISDANVHIVNSKATSTITIDDVTNNTGWLQIVDAPPGVNAYQVSVTKPGYSTDITYATSTQNINPLKPHATVLNQQVTQVSFAIDKLSQMNVRSKNLNCAPIGGINFSLTGSKKIGQNPDVLKFTNDYTTSGSGLKTITNMEWDTYTMTLGTNSYDLLGMNPISPLSLLPDSTLPIDIILGPKNPKSLLVLVKDAINLPISDAKVTIEKDGVSEFLNTSEGFVTQTDWSHGEGQSDYPGLNNPNPGDISKFDSFPDSNQLEVNSPSGVLKLKSFSGSYNSEGSLISSTFDIGTSSNYAFLRFLPIDQPALAGPDSVRFQIASSATNTATTTWNFVGPDGTSATYYSTSNQSLSPEHSNKQFLKYKIYMSTEDSTVTPTISDISFTFISSCVPPGQVLFSNLSSGTYNVTIEKTGYQTHSGTVNIAPDYQTYTSVLTP